MCLKKAGKPIARPIGGVFGLMIAFLSKFSWFRLVIGEF
jgi:hypothetical protein